MIGETNEERNERLSKFTDTSRKKLNAEGIPFEEKNGGNHFVVDHCFDYWPTTGKFINRDTKKVGRGIFNLLKEFR